MNIVFRKFDLSVRTKHILFRFDYSTFCDSMSKLGINLPNPPPQSGSGYVFPSGVIPVGFGRTGLEVDVSRGIMSARGVLPNETLDLFNKMIESVRHDLDLNLDETAWFYEIISNCSVRIDKDPLEALSKKFDACCNLGEIETILPGGAQVNRVRIGPRSAYPNRPDYYDIDVMPDIFRPRDSVLIEFVYRGPRFEAIRKTAGDMENLISKVVEAVI